MYNDNFNIFVSCRLHIILKILCHVHICVMSDSQIQKKKIFFFVVFNGNSTFCVMSYAQIQIKNENKTLVMTIFAPCQSLPIRKKCSSCISKIKFFVPLRIKIFTKNACHDHILVMSNSQIPQKRQPSTMEIQHFQVISVSLNS